MSIGELSVSRIKRKDPLQVKQESAAIAKFYRTFSTEVGAGAFKPGVIKAYTVPRKILSMIGTSAFLFYHEGKEIQGVVQLRANKGVLIDTICVLDSHQHKGIGQKLYLASFGYARKHRLHRVNAMIVSRAGIRLAAKTIETPRKRYSGFKKRGNAETFVPIYVPLGGGKNPVSRLFLHTKVVLPRRKKQKSR